MVNRRMPALPLRLCAASIFSPFPKTLSPALESLGKAAFRKLSDIQMNSMRSQKAFGYLFEANMVSECFRTTFSRLMNIILNSESFRISFAR